MSRFAGFMVVSALSLVLAPVPSNAQFAERAPEAGVEKELSRDAIELREAVDVRPVDRDFINSALVFNNTGATTTVVFCAAFDGNGRPVGRLRTKIPARGLRFLWASDFGNGRDYIGSALCSTTGRVAGSALLLGAGGTTDLKVSESEGRAGQLIRFGLIATR